MLLCVSLPERLERGLRCLRLSLENQAKTYEFTTFLGFEGERRFWLSFLPVAAGLAEF